MKADDEDVGRWSGPQRVTALGCVVVGVVVRWSGLGSSVLTFDEAFTASAAERPASEMFRFLAANDSHPPLDYLVRAPFVSTHSELWLRVPSAVWATLTLLAVLWWMRDRGWFGVFVVGVSAIAAIQVLYAHQARMYALLILGGTLAAIAAERWLVEGRARWLGLAGGALCVGLFTHVSAMVFAVGMVTLVGLRRDGEAWRWRAAVGLPVLLFLVIWGPSLRDQMATDHAGWIPHTSVGGFVDAVAGQLSLYDGSLALFAVIVAGGVVLVRRGDALGRVWLCMCAVPTVLLAVAGTWAHVLLPRSLTFGTWGAVVSVAALAAWVIDARSPIRSGALRVTCVVALGVLVVPSVLPAMTFEEDSAPARRRLAEVVADGDVVAVSPGFLAPMLLWDHDLAPSAAPDVDLGANSWAAQVGAGASSGRVWLLVPDSWTYRPPAEFVPCAQDPTWHGGDLTLFCWSLPS